MQFTTVHNFLPDTAGANWDYADFGCHNPNQFWHDYRQCPYTTAPIKMLKGRARALSVAIQRTFSVDIAIAIADEMDRLHHAATVLEGDERATSEKMFAPEAVSCRRSVGIYSGKARKALARLEAGPVVGQPQLSLAQRP